MLVLLPMFAFAGWKQVTAAGSVQDLQVLDAGVVLIASTTSGLGVWQISDAGVSSLNSMAGAFVGGGSFGAGCLVGLTGGGTLVLSSPACGTSAPLGPNTWQRFRLISDSPPYGVAIVTSASADTVWSGSGTGAGWAARGFSVTGSGVRTLQNVRIGGIEYAVASGNNGVRVSVDGGDPGNVIPGTIWRDAAPFSIGGAPAILGMAASGLALLRDYRTPSVFTPTIPPGFTPRFGSMALRTGMVTTLSGELLAPIPNPAKPAETWVVRSGPPSALLSERINCAGDRSCVTATDAGVVWFWENELAPTVTTTVPQLDAGQTIRLTAAASDGDGDPVFVTWSGGDGVFTPVPGSDDGTLVDFTAPAGICAPAAISVSVTDGSRSTTQSFPITVITRGALGIDGGTAPALAGGPAIVFSAFLDGGCPAAMPLAWSTTEGQTGSGNQFAWTPPCDVTGAPITISATATWSSGTPATTSASSDVIVQGWAAPPAPVFMPANGTQQSGTVVDWPFSAGAHMCSTSMNFPGTEVVWAIDGGGLFPLVIDGGLRIDAPRCAAFPVRVTASAFRRVVGETLGSDAGTLTVDVVPDALPLDANTGLLITAAGDAGLLFGTLAVDAGCLAERAATVEISVSSAGRPVVDGGFPAEGGSWALPVAGGCSGGVYDVTARLFEGGVFTGAAATSQATLSFAPARVGALSVDRVDVTCGAGAKAQVRLLAEPNSCAVAEVSWRAVSGPALLTNSGTGETLELQTEALDFSVVGQQLSFEFRADSGAGNLDVATRTIELGVQPFLEVRVHARPPLRREEEGASLEVTLTNPTACQVDGLALTLPFSGGTPLLETALLDGHRVNARSTEAGVVIDAVSVPALGSATLQLTAKARLLSTPTVLPVASLNGYVVSTAAPALAPATGCGCAELSSPVFLALLTLVLRRRRRSPE